MSGFLSSDGVVWSSTAEGYALYERILADAAAADRSWTEILRGMGVKLSHPDDGWVHEESREYGVPPGKPGYLSVSWYPMFDDRPQPGDLIALGSPGSGHIVCRGGHRASFRLMRVTRVEHGGVLIPATYYHYEPTGILLPPPPEGWFTRSKKWATRRARRQEVSS